MGSKGLSILKGIKENVSEMYQNDNTVEDYNPVSVLLS